MMGYDMINRFGVMRCLLLFVCLFVLREGLKKSKLASNSVLEMMTWSSRSSRLHLSSVEITSVLSLPGLRAGDGTQGFTC